MDDEALPEPVEGPASSSNERAVYDIAAHFDAEETDDRWSSSAEIAIETAFAEDSESRATVRRAECRSTVCRIDVEFPSPGDQLRGAPILPMLVPWAGHSHLSMDPERGTVVLHVAREGHSLRGEALESTL